MKTMKTKKKEFVITVTDSYGEECAIQQKMAWQTLGMWTWFFLVTQGGKEIKITLKQQ